MSWKYVQAAWERRAGLSSLEVVVLLELTDRANGQAPASRGACPGQKELAEQYGVSVRSVMRALRSLQERGFLDIERRGLGQTNAYRLSGAICPESPVSHPESPVSHTESPVSHTESPVGHFLNLPSVTRTIGKEPQEDEPEREIARGRSLAELQGEWTKFAEAVKAAGHSAPTHRKWDEAQNRRLRKLDRLLEGNWEELHSVAPRLWARGADVKANFSLQRLTSDGCARAQEVLDGMWTNPKAKAPERVNQYMVEYEAAEAKRELAERMERLKREQEELRDL